jgi:hypothetical protein
MHYSDNEGSVRVDFFKESGKWGYTEALDMNAWYDKGYPPNGSHSQELPHCVEAVRRALRERLISDNGADHRMGGLIYVVLEPYHLHAHPVMGQVDDLFPEREV